MRRRRRLTVAATAAMTLTLTATLTGAATGGDPSAAAPAASRTDSSFPARIPLPDGFQPEGITIGRGATAWFGSRADGDIYQVDLRSGAGRVISQGPGTPSVGLKTDGRRLLYVSGGTAGTARVVDVRTGDIVRDYTLATTPSFVNDVVLTRRAAWFTDSLRPQLYRVARSADGRPAEGATTLTLSGDWVQGAGNNANGITTTPDGQALLVINSSDSRLYRVDPRTGDARVVDLGGEVLTNGDGLLREGRTLYVVQNRLNRIAVVHLDRSGERGELEKAITSPAFDVPTTVARFGDALYLPNARFTTPATPTTTYDVTRVIERR